MRTPSPPYCRLDLAPPLADRFIFGVAPIDYSPVLLLMPFGFHLAVDTLPSGNCKRWLQVRLGCVQLSPSCPFRLLHTFLSPGPRGITPAFGYGAPHPSARGTSTLLNNALLSAHYDSIRLSPHSVLLLVGDVSGKGVPAALIMSGVRASARLSAAMKTGLEELVFRLNEMLYESTADTSYLTLFAAEIDVAAGSLRYINAGHPPPLLHTVDGIHDLECGTPPLGLFQI